MDHRFPSGSLTLAGYLARAPRASAGMAGGRPGVIMCHGFPQGAGGAATSARTFPELCDRIANELGMTALAFTFRGAGASEGNFSIDGWLLDLIAAIDHLCEVETLSGLWLVGFGAGGALALCAAARDERVLGVAVLGCPADFDHWASEPRRFLQHAREIGLIKDDSYPASLDRWAKPLAEIRAVGCAAQLAPRALLVVHGTDDEVVPDLDARVVADAHGSAELRFIEAAGNRLRHDPRVVAILLGWLDRERHRRTGGGTSAA